MRFPGTMHRRALLKVALLGVTVAILAGVSIPPTGGPGPAVAGPAMTAATGPSPTGTDYAVTFTESGLPSGTLWNVTTNGTTRNSTTPTVAFSEPDGSYMFFIGSVPGYTTGPELNVTVNGAPVNVPILYTPNTPVHPSCSSFVWIGGNYLFQSNCRGLFNVDYRTHNTTTGNTTDENSSFALGAVAEVASNGVVEALGVPGYQGYGEITVSATPEEINMTDVITGNVTNATGVSSNSGLPDGETPLWTPDQAPGSAGTTYWGSGGKILGRSTVTVVFHFSNESGNTSDHVEFDVSVAGWPWQSTGDFLGIEVGTTAEQGTHLAYSSATSTLSELWDSSGAVATNLTFGASANATGSSDSVLSVTEQVGLEPSGPGPTASFVLVSFAGPGGYSNLTYDPWITFGATPLRPVIGPSAVIAAVLPLGAVAAIAVAVAGLGIVAFRARRHPPEEGLT
jgi:hypothetical protein